MFTFKTEETVAKGAMHTRPWKLILAGVVVACAFGGIALRLAWATPGDRFTSILIGGPVAVDEIDVKSDTDSHKLAIKTKGVWNFRVVMNHIPPGGHTGWHSHPGPAFVMIEAGAMTLYQADGTSAVYPAGTGFAEPPGHVHIGRNEGTTDLEIVAFHLTPSGEAPRTDEDDPRP